MDCSEVLFVEWMIPLCLILGDVETVPDLVDIDIGVFDVEAAGVIV